MIDIYIGEIKKSCFVSRSARAFMELGNSKCDFYIKAGIKCSKNTSFISYIDNGNIKNINIGWLFAYCSEHSPAPDEQFTRLSSEQLENIKGILAIKDII